VDRFKDGYPLLKIGPRLRIRWWREAETEKSGPLGSYGCKVGPAPLGKDSAKDGPPPFQAVCQNMTMAQFAEQLPSIGQLYIHNPVLDASGIEGAWDFTLSFSPVPPNMMNGGGEVVVARQVRLRALTRPLAEQLKHRNPVPPFHFSTPLRGSSG